MPKKIILDEEKLLREYRENNTFDEIARLNNVSKDVINRYFREFKNKGIKLGRGKIQPRRYPLEENFFEQIDSEEKAYILGFIAADGSLINDSNRIVIGLKITDKLILEKIDKIIYTDGKNHLTTQTQFDRRTNKEYYSCRLSFYSDKIYNDLINLGLTPRKSLTLQYPIQHIPKHLENHFIRGYFDGDGSICINQEKQKQIHIRGTEQFLRSIHNIFVLNCNLSTDPKSIKKDSGIFSLQYNGNGVAKKIGDYLYKDATIYLERKYKKFC